MSDLNKLSALCERLREEAKYWHGGMDTEVLCAVFHDAEHAILTLIAEAASYREENKVLREELASFHRVQESMNEAFNRGDGSYKP